VSTFSTALSDSEAGSVEDLEEGGRFATEEDGGTAPRDSTFLDTSQDVTMSRVVTLSTLLVSLGDVSSCSDLGSIFTSYLSDPALLPARNFGLGKDEGKEMLLLRDLNKLLVRDL
jgi:hypothetical protein